MKKAIAIFSVAALVTGTVPRKAQAGILEGALIGGAIGAVVGLTIEWLKPKPKAKVEEASPATPAAQESPRDSTNTLREELEGAPVAK